MTDTDQVCEAIRQKYSGVPDVCLVLGSGLGAIADKVKISAEFSYSELPGVPFPRAFGHVGRLLLGELGSKSVAVFSGRSHFYEGHSVETATLGIRAMRQMGARYLFLSNAAGGVDPRLQKGDIVAIDQHIDLFFGRSQMPPTSTPNTPSLDGPPLRGQCIYDLELVRESQRIAASLGFSLQRGTYLATLGPTYETRAEYRFFRKIGADTVGMSTVPEALIARGLGYRIGAFSVVTNEARPDAISKTTHEEVLDVAKVAQERLVPLVEKLLQNID